MELKAREEDAVEEGQVLNRLDDASSYGVSPTIIPRV